MKHCVNCKAKALSQKHLFSTQYRCKACGAVCAPSATSKAVNHLIINILPVLGVLLAVLTKSAAVFLVLGIALPLLLAWWQQNNAQLKIVKFSH